MGFWVVENFFWVVFSVFGAALGLEKLEIGTELVEELRRPYFLCITGAVNVR